jgi:hypothetical protein
LDRDTTRFMTAFEEVTTALRHRPGGPRREDRVPAAQRAVADGAMDQQDSILYQELAPLRDCLAHARHRGQPLARPTPEAIRALEALRAKLTGSLGTVWPFCGPVTVVPPTTSVADACRLMRAHDFSTLPVVSETGLHGLLSATDVVWWVGGALEDILLLEDVPVSEVMHAHTSVDHVLVGRRFLQRDVPALFSGAGESRCPVGAVLVTANGHPHEAIVGILTPWDLPELS